MDDIYAVYYKWDGYRDSQKILFKGTLPEVNAWLSLVDKGFTL
jgi:hypothetical protein